MKRLHTGTVAAQQDLGNGYLQMDIRMDLTDAMPQPGHFCFIKPTVGAPNLLRRAFGISGVSEDTISIIYDVRGGGTADLARRTAGESIEVMSPLGKAFPPLSDDTDPVLVAGGTGFGPMWFMATQLAAAGRGFTFVFGAASEDKLMMVKELQELCPKAIFTTDDGSFGTKGRVTDALPIPDQPTTYYAVGPTPMMKAVAQMVVPHGHSCLVSLEEYMGCGIGICVGCVCDLNNDGNDSPERRTARVCIDGPVFDAKELAWGL